MISDTHKRMYTERLELRQLSIENPEILADFFDMYSDSRAMRFMPSLPHKTAEETQTQLITELSRKGAYYWGIFIHNHEKPIGYVSFLGETRFPGMGYMLHPDYWGQGYAPEACQKVLEFGFEELNYSKVELWIDETNAASIRVAQKLGFGLKGSIQHKYSHRESYHTMLVYGLLPPDKVSVSAIDSRVQMYRSEPVLMVHDVLKTVNFYKEKLGFNIDFVFGEPADHAGISYAEWTGQGVIIQLTRVPEERELTPSSYLHIIIDENIDKLYESYGKAGVELISELQNKPWGMREFAIRDLNGYALVLATHL